MSEGFRHESWSSRTIFLLAAVGAAVGLGNIWRFPYQAGTSGGSAFVLIYLAAIFLIAIPILIAETMIGRHGHMSAPVSMARAAEEAGTTKNWGYVGWFGVAAAFFILTFYSVIGGWVLAYIPKLITGYFTGADATFAEGDFNGLLADPVTMIFWHTIFMAVTAGVVSQGIKSGIEKAVIFMMPALGLMMLVVVGYALAAGDMPAAMNFLFAADFSKINADVVLAAIGQAFFSVGIGMGIMFTYGAYLPDNVVIPRACISIAIADTLVAVLAGIAIFPIVFANGLDPAAGPGLVFVTLPLAFGQMTGGAVIGTLFFVLLAFAALTSAIALLEVPISWAEEHSGWPRKTSAWVVGGLIWLIGLGSVLSFNAWSDVYLLGFVERFETSTIFDLVDYFTSNVLLLVGGLFIAVFSGWWMKTETLTQELSLSDGPAFKTWRFLVRFVGPIAIILILGSTWL